MKRWICAFAILFFSGNGIEAKVLNLTHLGNTVSDISLLVLQEAYQQLGITIIPQVLPGRRGLIKANKGILDGEMNRGSTDLLQKYYPNLRRVPVAINFTDWRVFSIEKDFVVNGYESLRPYKIGVKRGHISMDTFTQGMQILYLNSVGQIFLMLEKGRVEVGLVTLSSGIRFLEKRPIENIKILNPTLRTIPLYHFLHKKHSGLITPLIKILGKMNAQGRSQLIREEFLRTR